MDWPARRILGSATLLIAATLTALPARASSSCLETRVTEVFVSPDGKAQTPGVVRICPHWTISPTLQLSRVLLNGRTLGLWMHRAGEGGRFAAGDRTITLRRLPGGRIALADYYWPGADGKPSAPGLRAAQLQEARNPLSAKPTIFESTP